MRDLRRTIPVNLSRDYPVRDVQDITHIIIHHSATVRGSAAAYANFHITEYNWPGIAYHYVIDKDGTVNKTLDHHKVGYHCRGMNVRSIGICLTGHFDKEEPTPEQLAALVELVVMLREPTDWEIGFHREYSEKTCPGDRFPYPDFLEAVRLTENPPQPEDEPEPDVPMSGPDFEPEPEPPNEPDKPANDKRDNPGCLFSIF